MSSTGLEARIKFIVFIINSISFEGHRDTIRGLWECGNMEYELYIYGNTRSQTNINHLMERMRADRVKTNNKR